jgi:hypothetical protein
MQTFALRPAQSIHSATFPSRAWLTLQAIKK